MNHPNEGAPNRLFELSQQTPFTVPEAVTKAAEGLERLRAARSQAQAQLDEPEHMPIAMEETLAAEAVEAAFAGGKLPNAKPYVDARAAEERYRFELTFLLRAEDIAIGRVQRVAADEGDVIIRSHLRPVHAKVVSEARKLGPQLQGATTEQAVLALDARAVWLRLAELAQTYQLVREARRVTVALMGASTSDTQEQFAELRDMDRHRPTNRTTAPWPEAPWARLAWISSNAEPWLPTPAEHEARFKTWLEESGANKRNEMHKQVHAMRGY